MQLTMSLNSYAKVINKEDIPEKKKIFDEKFPKTLISLYELPGESMLQSQLVAFFGYNVIRTKNALKKKSVDYYCITNRKAIDIGSEIRIRKETSKDEYADEKLDKYLA